MILRVLSKPENPISGDGFRVFNNCFWLLPGQLEVLFEMSPV